MITDRLPDNLRTLSQTVPSPPRVVRSRRARIIIGVLLAGVAWASLPFLGGLMGAVVLAVLLAPVHRALAPRVGLRRAAFLLALASTVLIVTPAALVLATGIREGPSLLQAALESSAFARLGDLRLGPIDVGAQIADAGQNVVSWASRQAMSAAGSVTHTILNLMLAVVGLYYLLPDGPAIWKRIRALIPFSADGTDRIAMRFASITEAALLGIVATAVLQGVTIALGFWLVGLPQPLFWGGVTGLVSILPIFGSSLVWVPAVVVLALGERAGAALALGLIGALISSNVDNVVRPVIYRRVSGLHPMASLVGAFAGMELFGLLGLILGPLAIAYCLELMRLYESEFAPNALPANDPSLDDR